MQENQAAVRDLSIGETFKKRHAWTLLDLLKDPDAALADQVRCVSALFSMHAGMFVLQDVEGDPEEKREAVLEVAVGSGHPGPQPGPRGVAGPGLR